MTRRLEFKETPLAGVQVLGRIVSTDPRGCFERLFCQDELEHALGKRRIAQINLSSTKVVGAVRGLHFQYPPCAETKIITCVKGAVFDVALDVRRSSRTFLQWFGVRLSEDSHSSFLIPEGFAHGFQVLSPDSQLLYIHTAPFAPNSQGVINALDPAVNINWPIPVTQRSDQDTLQPFIDGTFEGLAIPESTLPDAGGLQ
jgi:dTDP-4-dehydrorhamnose 3,5-epimerase